MSLETCKSEFDMFLHFFQICYSYLKASNSFSKKEEKGRHKPTLGSRTPMWGHLFAPLGNGGEKLSGSQCSASLQGGKVSNDGWQKCIEDRFLKPPKVTADEHYDCPGCFLVSLLDNKSWKMCSFPSHLSFLLRIPAGGSSDTVLEDAVSEPSALSAGFCFDLSSSGLVGKRVPYHSALQPGACPVVLLVGLCPVCPIRVRSEHFFSCSSSKILIKRF